MTRPFHRLALVLTLAGAAAALSDCASAPAPLARVRVREVETPVAVTCAPPLGPEPAYPDADAVLKAAPDLFARVRLLVAGRLSRIARERELNAALAACGAQPGVGLAP